MNYLPSRYLRNDGHEGALRICKMRPNDKPIVTKLWDATVWEAENEL